MKNKGLWLIFAAVALLAVVLPVVAYAETSGSREDSIDVSFVLTETDLTPESPEPPHDGGGGYAPSEPGGSYIINIPSNISLNHEQDFLVNWTYNSIPDTVQVVVSIDGARTFPDGEFYLVTDNGSTDTQRLVCSISRGSSADFAAPLEKVTGPNDAVVAVFRGGSNAPESYGWVKFGPSYTLNNVAGTYTGTVHFKVDVVGD